MGETLNKSMVIDGIAASEAVDSSGEVLDINGLDITDLEEGRGTLNYEHRGDQSNGASANDVIGHIIYAKKIFESKDCSNDRERSYWNKVQLPFVYIQAELFNDEGHPGATAAASLVRYYQKRKLPILMRYSIEGTTLLREGNKLKRAIAKRVAATMKPCNRSCESGVLSDDTEKGPLTDLKDLLSDKTLNKSVLGSFEAEVDDPVWSDPMDKTEEEDEDLVKALEAGGFNSAPGTLTQGSALQAENVDRARTLKNQTMAAFRDWKGKGDLKKFLKSRLPEASEDFIEHFAKLVEDYQLRKMVQLEDDLIKAVTGKKAATPKAPPVVAPEAKPQATTAQPRLAKPAPAVAHASEITATNGADESVDENAPMTIRGRALKPMPAVSGAHFDEKKGILMTPRGAFPMYLPQKDKNPGALESFHNILNDPKRTAFHDYATQNWMKLHNMMREGQIPPQVVMHAVLFSQLSPNKAVPMQELMYAHLVDSMKERGIDARDPRFAEGRQDWLGRDRSGNYPKTAHDYFTGYMNQGVTLKAPSKSSGRQPGDVASFMLPDDAYDNMSKYHELHPHLMNLVNTHRHDARSAVAELMNHKRMATNWSNVRRRKIQEGLGDIGPYQGANVPGLAPKTGRYMYAMMGGSNVHVPDTHFTRYLFGLEKNLDTNSINYLKQVLWNPNNSHVLDGVDRFYAKHHPAVEHMMQHPVFGKQFADRQDAIFPSFWKNWVAIVPHERARGMRTGGANAETDHRPFWEAISPFIKNEVGADLPVRTAQLHAQWAHQHGEIPAQMMYYAYIVPMLLRAQETPIQKMQRIASSLQKTQQDAQALPPIPAPERKGPAVKFKGNSISPGEIEILTGPFKGNKVQYLGKDDKHYYVRAQGEPTTTRLPKQHVGTAFRVNVFPKVLKTPHMLDANLHGDFNHNKTMDQHSLVHGLEYSEPSDAEYGEWQKNNLGLHEGWVKKGRFSMDWTEPDWERSVRNRGDFTPGGIGGRFLSQDHLQYSTAKRETLYHNMARDFFGLGHHVPTTATFLHPDTKEPMSVQRKVNGGFHIDDGGDESVDLLNKLHTDGSLDQLGLMDLAMGVSDRHKGNYLLTRHAPHIQLIDNELALNYDTKPEAYLWDKHHEMDPASLKGHGPNGRPTFSDSSLRELHPKAESWFTSLDPRKFGEQLLSHGVPATIAKVGVFRLMAMQAKITENKLLNKKTMRSDLIGAAHDTVDRMSGGRV
jgi:hypothetical protein